MLVCFFRPARLIECRPKPGHRFLLHIPCTRAHCPAGITIERFSNYVRVKLPIFRASWGFSKLLVFSKLPIVNITPIERIYKPRKKIIPINNLNIFSTCNLYPNFCFPFLTTQCVSSKVSMQVACLVHRPAKNQSSVKTN
jgi:hypothetical protein